MEIPEEKRKWLLRFMRNQMLGSDKVNRIITKFRGPHNLGKRMHAQ